MGTLSRTRHPTGRPRRTLARARRWSTLPAWLSLVIGAGITIFLYRMACRWELNRAEDDFERRANHSATTLIKAVDDHVGLLRVVALTAAMEMDRTGDGDLFSRLGIEKLLKQQRDRCAGLRSIAWAPVQKLADRPESFTVRSIYPAAPNHPWSGLDLAEDRATREALMEARKSGSAATAPMQFPEWGNRKLGFRVFIPASSASEMIAGARESRDGVAGFVVGSISIADLVKSAWQSFNLEGINFSLFDGPPRGLLRPAYHYESGVYTEAAPAASVSEPVVSGEMNWDTTVEMGGRRWWLLFYPSADYLRAHRTWIPWAVLSCGLLLSALFAAYLGQTAGRAAQVEGLVQQRTGELTAANQQLQTEILQRKFAVEQLRKLSRAVEQSPNAVIITDLHGIIQYVNPKFTEMTGYEPPESIGSSLAAQSGRGELGQSAHPLWQAVRAGQEWRGEVQSARKSGEPFWTSISSSPIQDQGGQVTHVVLVEEDITERKQSEQWIRESEERYRLLAENSTDMIFKLNVNGEALYVSPACARLLGYPPEELLGQPICRQVHPEERMEFDLAIQEAAGHPAARTVIHRMMTRDGQYLWLETATQAIRREGAVAATELIAVSRDITERKLLQEQFLQAQKMEVIGRLAGGMAHDFNNMLTAIFGFAQICLRRMAPEDACREYIREIITTGERAANIIRQLLAFSRRQVHMTRRLRIDEILSGMERLLRSTLGEDIRLALDLNSAATVDADPGLINQVITNLAVNARDAMSRGGSLTIHTSPFDWSPQRARRDKLNLKAGQYVVISVKDTGCGMSEEVCQRAFEPFFTTKDIGKGTGLGLSTAYGIITQLGGEIEIYSEVGSGSEFRIYLPRVADAEEPAEVPAIAVAPSGRETILVVEDDDAVRGISIHLLQQLGYQTLEARNGLEGLEKCRGNNGRIDLIFTDVVMPHLCGPDMVEQLRELNADYKVLYCSGYNEHPDLEQSRKQGNVCFLEKPFTEESLATMVRSALDSNGRHPA